MSDNENIDASEETIDIRYGTIFRYLHGTYTEALFEGFGNMFKIFGTEPELVESRVRTAVLERFGAAMDWASLAESQWKAVDETRSDARIDRIINEASYARIALPPPQLLEKLDDVSPGTAKRIIDKGMDYQDAARRTEEDSIARSYTFRVVAQGIGLSVLLFSLMLSVAFAVVGEPILSSTSLVVAGTTYLAKIKTRAWSRNRRNDNLEIASRLLRQASRFQSTQER